MISKELRWIGDARTLKFLETQHFPDSPNRLIQGLTHCHLSILFSSGVSPKTATRRALCGVGQTLSSFTSTVARCGVGRCLKVKLFVTTSEALVTRSDALVTSSFLLLLVRHLLLVAMHLLLVASCLVRHLLLEAMHLFLVASCYY